MLKWVPVITAVTLSITAPAAAQAALGPDAASCRQGAGDPAVLVNVSGFKNRDGNLRVQLYGGNPEDFLAKGKRLRRIDLPVTPAGAMKVCVAVPKSGNYAIAVRHDADGNGKSGWNDGGGFSRNPNISLMSLKPKYHDVVIPVANGVKPIDVVLNYRRGLKIGPVGGN
ncbi:DUF2141 domain-containing protein [Allosphingosinicella indica]|uniref:Uncharacterized conserved protein, DUF2141 family n=1 Tax=Allosphingosinicella indica TaxID=941907 RepID=A0A1X7GTX6_9SPHN|nr:DUF2141 domain-containing protein [Allosphingosinicella indica]SMF73924.1 Uncharacterized conserved protein, DUF2141 family [Allosphingosinicella indica]